MRDLTSLQYMMNNLKECRENESKHSTQIRKLIASFELLTRYLPEGVMSAEELDCTNVLETTYKKLSDHCEDASQDVANMQAGFKKGLLKDVVDFQGDMKRFRDEWLTKVKGLLYLACCCFQFVCAYFTYRIRIAPIPLDSWYRIFRAVCFEVSSFLWRFLLYTCAHLRMLY